MNPALKRFNRRYLPAADAISSAAIDQACREVVAEAVADALDGQPDFKRDLFALLAADPLVPCAGSHGEPCPDGRVLRIRSRRWHVEFDEEGRAVESTRVRIPFDPAWVENVRCVTCGAREFIPGYAEAHDRKEG